MELVETIKVGATLGECVLWCDRTQSVWWTDIEARALYRFDWADRHLERFATPERLASFGFVEGSDHVIAAFESGFAFYEPRSGTIRWLARHGQPGIRLNDGRVDRQGRFWAGGMAETREQAGAASLYCFDGLLRTRESGLTIANSICWSVDGRRFYFSDTLKRVIWRYAFDCANGEISDRQVFVEMPEGAYPDGSVIDADGYLWNAQWGGGRVVRYAPDGRVDRILDVPASQPTCVAFGGPGLNLLFVTTARAGLSEEELSRQVGAGEVYVYNTEFVGLPECRFCCGSPGSEASGGKR